MPIEESKILLGHGSGGKLMSELIREEIVAAFGDSQLQLDDGAYLKTDGKDIVFTTDSYTIDPIFFNGGDIGSLAVNGTVNDIAVMGAIPRYLSCSFIIEAGLPLVDLRKILKSMQDAAAYAGVSIVTGDTKVVEKGKGDKIFINTAGIGIVSESISRRQIDVGDKIIVNGSIGDHGVSILALRNKLSLSSEIASDCAPLNHLIQKSLAVDPKGIKFIRDATRGGVSSVLTEIVDGQPFSAKLIESELPIHAHTKSICDILGLDPLYSANEGKLIMIVSNERAEAVLKEMRSCKEGVESQIIGEITDDFNGRVFVETPVKGKRMVAQLLEDQLPRIC